MGSQQIYTYKTAGTHRLTVPSGYSPYILVYAWGAGGGVGSDTRGGLHGGAGGYAFTVVEVSPGDELLIGVGGAGEKGSGTSRGAGGVGLVLQGSTSTNFTNTVVYSPTEVENGFFTRTAHAEGNPNSNVRQYYVRYQGETVWSSSNPPPIAFQPGTYRGSVYSRAIGGPGGGDNLNAFDLNSVNSSVTLRGGPGGAQRDEDNDAGAAGGGGGASAVLINNVPFIVAAGGGGGGGYGEDHAGGATSGHPGGIYPGSLSSISPWYPVSDGRWGSFINTYGIWKAPTGGTHSFQIVLEFPTSGTYTFYASSDNNASWRVDSGTTYTTSFTQFGSYTTQTISLSAGNHTIYASIANPGDVGGWAMRIMNPDGSEFWHTRKPNKLSGLNYTSEGAPGQQGGGGSGGGGGGYPYGGASWPAPGDDRPGAPGGNGGQIYVYGSNIRVAGQTISPEVEPGLETGEPGGLTSAYYPGSKRGYPGYDGAVVVVFTKAFRAWVKESGIWKDVGDAWVKVNNTWKRIEKAWVKHNNQWKALEADILDGPQKSNDTVDPISDRRNIEFYLWGTNEETGDPEITYNYSVFGKAARAGYVPGKTTITVTIDANAVVSSTSTTSPALIVNGFTAGDTINIINNGLIKGSGNIGIAISAEDKVTITNNGTIIGGNTQVGNSVTVTPATSGDYDQSWRDVINGDPVAEFNGWSVVTPPIQPLFYYGELITYPEYHGKDLFIDLKDDTVFSSENETQTTVTSGDYTYTRGSLAYTYTLDFNQLFLEEFGVVIRDLVTDEVGEIDETALRAVTGMSIDQLISYVVSSLNIFPVYTINAYNYSYTVGRNAIQGNSRITWSTLGTISGGSSN